MSVPQQYNPSFNKFYENNKTKSTNIKRPMKNKQKISSSISLKNNNESRHSKGEQRDLSSSSSEEEEIDDNNFVKGQFNSKNDLPASYIHMLEIGDYD